MKENWRQYQNYIIIAVLSLISVFFLPMLGSSVGIGFNIPSTLAGWIVWILTKLCVVVVNILIFDQFVKQAKVNVKDNENFKKAEEILNLNIAEKENEILPAEKYIHKLYRKKGLTLAITTVLSIFGLTNAILSFDWVSMLTYLFTIVMALIFGWITMNSAEEIWIDKHYKYALKVEMEKKHEEEVKKSMELAETKSSEQGDDKMDNNRRINLLESSMDFNPISLDSKPLVLDCSWSRYNLLDGPIYSGNRTSNRVNIPVKENICKKEGDNQ